VAFGLLYGDHVVVLGEHGGVDLLPLVPHRQHKPAVHQAEGLLGEFLETGEVVEFVKWAEEGVDFLLDVAQFFLEEVVGGGEMGVDVEVVVGLGDEVVFALDLAVEGHLLVKVVDVEVGTVELGVVEAGEVQLFLLLLELDAEAHVVAAEDRPVRQHVRRLRHPVAIIQQS